MHKLGNSGLEVSAIGLGRMVLQSRAEMQKMDRTMYPSGWVKLG